MSYRITYYNRTMQQNILSLPTTLAARYIALTSRMQEHGANLGEPHTKSLGDGLLEL